MSNDKKTLYERLGGYAAIAAVAICCPGSGPIRSSGGSGRIVGKTASCARSSSSSISSARAVYLDKQTISEGLRTSQKCHKRTLLQSCPLR